MELSEKELVGWTYRQVKSTEKSQQDLAALFQEEFKQPPESFINFLVDSKYFRRTGVGDSISWSVSANRHDDLRDFLAE